LQEVDPVTLKPRSTTPQLVISSNLTNSIDERK
jgi:hypothetical protein